MAFAGGAGAFGATGLPLATSAPVLEGGLDFAVQKKLTLGVSYEAQTGQGMRDQGVKSNLLWRF